MKRFLATLLTLGFCLIAPSVAIAEEPDTSKTLEQLLTPLLLPILLGIAGAIACILLVIYTRHQQEIAIIAPGKRRERKGYLLIVGPSLIAIGGALLLALWLISRELEFATKDTKFFTSLILLSLGGALIVGHLLTKKFTPIPPEITQRRERMKALLNQLKSFKNAGDPVEIKLMDGSNPTGTIRDIIDDELVVLEVPGQPQRTFISIDKIVSIRRV